MKYLLVLAAILGIIAVGSANSFATTGTDPIYMKYGTIQGDVTDKAYQNAIELTSFQFGVARQVTGATGSGSTSEPTVSEITITKPMDSSSPALLQQAFGGTPQTAEIYFVTASGTGTEVVYAEYKLTNAIVTGYSVSSGGDRPTESLSLAFSKIQFEYKSPSTTGTSTGTGTGTVTWDLTQQKLS